MDCSLHAARGLLCSWAIAACLGAMRQSVAFVMRVASDTSSPFHSLTLSCAQTMSFSDDSDSSDGDMAAMVMQMIASEKQKEKKKGAKKLQAAQSAIMADLDAKVGPQPSW